MKILLVEAQLTKFSRVKDGSVNLSFRTAKEMGQDEFSLVDQYYQQNGFLAFKRDEVKLEEIPQENTKIDGQRSRSQMLRTKLFALHMKKGGSKDTFQDFYEKWYNAFDQSVQDQLDAIEE